MDVMRNRIRPILDSLRQWRCRFSEELTEVEIRPGDYHFSEKLDAGSAERRMDVFWSL